MNSVNATPHSILSIMTLSYVTQIWTVTGI